MTRPPAYWDRSDRFFLADALARGMSIPEIARFLNRSEDEVRKQSDLKKHGYQQLGSSAVLANKSRSNATPGLRARLPRRRASAAHRKDS
jgi:IS30 family transposase